MSRLNLHSIDADAAGLSLSAAAAARLGHIAQKSPATPFLRLMVEGGGCSGFSYKFDLVAAAAPDDVTITRDGATLLVDHASLPFLTGSEVDFVEALVGASFQVINPNAKTSCGCGTSFSV